MHMVIGINMLIVGLLLLLSALKTQANGEHVLGRWKRASGAGEETCLKTQKHVDDRITSMNNISRKSFAEDVEFKEDNKFSLQMSWTGNDTERVIVVTSESGTSTVYLSDETGKKFENISTRVAGATSNCQLSLQKHPLVPQTVYILAQCLLDMTTSLYISNDAGVHFHKVALSFSMLGSLIFHPDEPNYILANGGRKRQLFLSKDKGDTWSSIKSDVISFKWSTAPHSVDIYAMTGKFYIYTDSKSNSLEKSSDFGKSWTQLYKSIYSFGLGGNFLYTSVFLTPNSNERRLVVSTDAGSKWNHVLLPTITPDRFYSILDATEGQIFLHVDDPGDTGKGTLFLSDATGIGFSKSLENHLYPNFQHQTDFYRVQSMRGVYIANQLEPSDNSIHTVITFNRGGDWQPVKRPENVPCADETKACSLQIHNAYSRSRGIRSNLPLSVPNAVGIILVHGHIASSLQNSDPDVFVSSDGGYNWRLALKGPHHYVIGDHGGLLVAVPADTPTPSVVKFSTDEGRCWINYTFTEHPVHFTGLLVEPGNKAMVVAIWGYTQEERIWHTFFINFTALIDTQCKDSDYDEWVAHSHQAGGCMLGSNETFRRLKPESWCYNGKAYVVNKTAKSCACTVDDFDCDFGYMRQENVDKCVEDPSLKDKQIHICERHHKDNIVAVGYHKIPGDKCKGGFFPNAPTVDLLEMCQNGDSWDELSAKAQKLHDKKPDAVTVIVAVVVICCVIGAAVAITIYAKKRRMFAQSYHYMSIRSDDSNKPVNTSVYDDSSDDEPVRP